MTRAEALAEARRRWGKSAFVDSFDHPCEVGVERFVTKQGRGRDWTRLVKGTGSSWEAAFADADRRGNPQGGSSRWFAAGEDAVYRHRPRDPKRPGRLARLTGQPVTVIRIHEGHLNTPGYRRPYYDIRFKDGLEIVAAQNELRHAADRRGNPDLSQLGYLPPEGLAGFWADFQEGTKEYRDWARGGDGRREDKAVWIDIENDFDHPFVWLRNIGSYSRGQGKASKALSWLCDLADRWGIELRLEASPLVSSAEEVRSGKALSLWHLKRWYKRHGFKPIPGRGGAYMRRRPKN